MPEQPPKTSKTGSFGVLLNKSSDANISVHAASASPSCFGTNHMTVLSNHLGRRSTVTRRAKGV